MRNLITNLMNAPGLSVWLAKNLFGDRFQLPAA
jgi:hypothetical protein